jgi:hypothetical protein
MVMPVVAIQIDGASGLDIVDRFLNVKFRTEFSVIRSWLMPLGTYGKWYTSFLVVQEVLRLHSEGCVGSRPSHKHVIVE